MTQQSKTIKEKTFSKQDLEEAQLQAIMNYEKIRKSRKEKKASAVERGQRPARILAALNLQLA